jgi:alpha-N-acetylglucosaminidase
MPDWNGADLSCVSLNGTHLDLPSLPPETGGVIRKEFWAKYHYVPNYCCFGYSLPRWDCAQRERLIDWMALKRE